MEILEFLWPIKSLSGFSAPDGLIHVFGLCDGVLGLATAKISTKVIPSFVGVKSLDKLLLDSRRLTKEVFLGIFGAESNKCGARLVTVHAHDEAVVVASKHILRLLLVSTSRVQGMQLLIGLSKA